MCDINGRAGEMEPFGDAKMASLLPDAELYALGLWFCFDLDILCPGFYLLEQESI